MTSGNWGDGDSDKTWVGFHHINTVLIYLAFKYSNDTKIYHYFNFMSIFSSLFVIQMPFTYLRFYHFIFVTYFYVNVCWFYLKKGNYALINMSARVDHLNVPDLANKS